jgi:adenylate cyclase
MMSVGRFLSAGRLACCFAALALVWGGFLGIRHISGAESFVDSLENLTIDWRYRLAGPRPAPHNVVIAAIDDEAVREAGPIHYRARRWRASCAL